MMEMAMGGPGVMACIACATSACPAVIAACIPAGVAVSPGAAALCIVWGCSPCVPACTIVSALCFHNDTMIDTIEDGIEKQKSIAIVKEGDRVLTDTGYTVVTACFYVPGNFDMLAMRFQTPASALVVTTDHPMLVGDKAVMAPTVQTGMAIPRRMDMDPTVVGIDNVKSQGKWALSTETCTVYANSILAGTVCSNISSPLGKAFMQTGAGAGAAVPKLFKGQVHFLRSAPEWESESE